MGNLKIRDRSLTISRMILVFFIAMLIIVLPQLNRPEYVLPTITSKLIYFLYGSLVLLALYTLSILFSKKISFRFSRIDVGLFILVLYITINRYFIQSHFGFSIRYIELLGLCFFYIVLRHISLKNYPWILLSVVISGIIQAIYGNLQLFGYYASNHSGFKMTGSFFNPGPYAGFLVSVWTVALGLYLFKENIIIQIQSQRKNNSLFLNAVIKYIFEYIPLLGITSIAIVLPALQSRASWISAIVGGGILLELRYHFLQGLLKKGTLVFKKIVIISLSIVIFGTVLFSLYHYKKASSDGRAFIWKVTTEMIVDNPVFGVGFDFFKAHYMGYQAQYFSENGETTEVRVADNIYYAFNDWLQFVAENGFLGFTMLLIVGFILFNTKAKSTSLVEGSIAKTSLLTIGVFACFSYPMQVLPIKLVLVALLAMLSNSTSDTFQLKIIKSKKQQWFFKSMGSLLGFFCIYQTFFYTKNLSEGFITWNNALKSHQYGYYKESILEFKLAYPIFKRDGDFLMNYGKTLSISGVPYKAITILEQAQQFQSNIIIATALGDSYIAIGDYHKAELAYQQAINMAPGKFYANYLLAKLYTVSGQEEKAVTIAKMLMNKEIKIPSTAIIEIRREMNKILLKYKNPLGFKN